MLLGKRQRPPIKRTTSMTGITFDLSNTAEYEDGDKSHHQQGLDQRFMSSSSSVLVSPKPRTSQRRNSADFLETAPFLKACSLCKRRLIPGRDIYMYRGDSAFCSLECRQQQMNQDERKENNSKCSVMVSKKKLEVANIATGSEVVVVSTNGGETLAAV